MFVTAVWAAPAVPLAMAACSNVAFVWAATAIDVKFALVLACNVFKSFVAFAAAGPVPLEAIA